VAFQQSFLFYLSGSETSLTDFFNNETYMQEPSWISKDEYSTAVLLVKHRQLWWTKSATDPSQYSRVHVGYLQRFPEWNSFLSTRGIKRLYSSISRFFLNRQKEKKQCKETDIMYLRQFSDRLLHHFLFKTSWDLNRFQKWNVQICRNNYSFTTFIDSQQYRESDILQCII